MQLLLIIKDVAALISFSSATVTNWAYGRKPAPPGFPKPVKIGRNLRYRRSDIEAWVASFRPDPQLVEVVPSPPQPSTGRPRGRPPKTRLP